MSALIVENLTKKYPSFSLDKVSFSVANGHIAGLIGANGAGKSTIIKSILQLVSANGKITVFGKDISDNEIAIKQLIGFVGGGFRFYPMKKLSSVRKIYAAFYPAWNQEKYNNYLLQFNISESKRVKELSDGMKIKFALALALSHGAKLLILDEPTSGLDPPVPRGILRHNAGARKQRTCFNIVFNTYNIGSYAHCRRCNLYFPRKSTRRLPSARIDRTLLDRGIRYTSTSRRCESHWYKIGKKRL